ncbi:FxSxx-COOH system tetratricopeptide repeat protein [Parafrankia elaeagni]|uniref:FxSxx-COOH system tetratricopeptide repeat protein n=1 Tax=Parafrankia elaeagni TaxID=222534 RepID=UPI0003825710|nr:FxSxx-COOH system tetratricopeptide repeat protein [Parafrankia elaeagni]
MTESSDLLSVDALQARTPADDTGPTTAAKSRRTKRQTPRATAPPATGPAESEPAESGPAASEPATEHARTEITDAKARGTKATEVKAVNIGAVDIEPADVEPVVVGDAPATRLPLPRTSPPPSLTGPPPSLRGALPPRNPHFTGRAGLLVDLHERLRAGETSDLPVALLGMGGVGTSQLAIEYVYRHLTDFDVVWWIPAGDETRIRQSLVELAERLGLGTGGGTGAGAGTSPEAEAAGTARTTKPVRRTRVAKAAETGTTETDRAVGGLVPAVLEALRVGRPHRRWLLVFDGADDPLTVRGFLPAGGDGRVLVTSRNAGWAEAAHSLEVDVFRREESLDLLHRRTGRTGASRTTPGIVQTADPEAAPEAGGLPEVGRVAEALGDLPLAVAQAAAWLAETGMPAGEYLRLLADRPLETLGTSSPLDYRLPVRAAWDDALDRLAASDPAALRLLRLCACLASAPIPRRLLGAGRNVSITPELDAVLRDPLRLGEAIRAITRQALARVDHRVGLPEVPGSAGALRVHRLVQLVVLDRMSGDERAELRAGARRLLAASDPGEPAAPWAWSAYAELYPHVIAAGAVEGREPLLRGMLVNTVRSLLGRGDHQEGLKLARQAHESWRVALGEEHPDTVAVGGWLGRLLLAVGDHAVSAPVNARVLKIGERVHGPDHPVTLRALAAVAADRRAAGEFTRAVELGRTAWARAVRAQGPDDPLALGAAHDLAVSLRLAGEVRQARDIDDDTWHRRRRGHRSRARAAAGAGTRARSGADDLAVLDSDSSRNLNLRALGDYLGARDRQEALAARLRALLADESHPDLLRALRHLAVVQRRAGEPETALRTSRISWQRLLARYGPDHPETLASALCHSTDLRHTGDLDGALRLCADVRAGLHGGAGAGHPHTRAAEANLAVIHRLRGDTEIAHELNTRVLAALTSELGPDHPLRVRCAVNLASDEHALGRAGTARALDEETLARARQRLGAEHPATLAVHANLATDLRALGETGPAEALHAEVVHALDRVLGDAHPATRSAVSWVRLDCDIDPLPL